MKSSLLYFFFFSHMYLYVQKFKIRLRPTKLWAAAERHVDNAYDYEISIPGCSLGPTLKNLSVG